MKFARRAKWLHRLFTASQAPPTRYPDRYSDDVSLVQLYDGGGWGFADPSTWITSVESAAIAAANTTILDVDVDSIFRLIAVSAFTSAAATPTNCTVSVQDPVTANVVALHAGQALNALGLVGKGFTPLGLGVLGPGHRLLGNHEGGDVTTKVTWRVYGFNLPLGVVPVF